MMWDSQNRMVSCSYSGNTLTFDYGSDGLRRSETLTSGGQSVTTYYVYDGQSLVMEETKNAQGVLTPSASYLNGPRGPEYKKDETTGLVKWYMYDGLGSVIGEVDPSGNVTYSAQYDVYGAVRGTTGTANTAQGFVGGCGHLSEAATGLIYMRARYYDPNTGRFVSQDPKGSGNNWFVYCADSPVCNIDFTGKDPLSAGVAFVLGYLMAAAGTAVFELCTTGTINWGDVQANGFGFGVLSGLLALLGPWAGSLAGPWAAELFDGLATSVALATWQQCVAAVVLAVAAGAVGGALTAVYELVLHSFDISVVLDSIDD